MKRREDCTLLVKDLISQCFEASLCDDRTRGEKSGGRKGKSPSRGGPSLSQKECGVDLIQFRITMKRRPGSFCLLQVKQEVVTGENFSERIRIPEHVSAFGQRKRKKPSNRKASFFVGSLALTYFRAVYLALSSALPRFTVLFGMGRRGSRALWAPDIACRHVVRDNGANSKEAG